MICDNPDCAAALAAARADNARLRGALEEYGLLPPDDDSGRPRSTCCECGSPLLGPGNVCDDGCYAMTAREALAAPGLTPERLRMVLADVYEAGQAVWHDHGVRVKDHKAASVAAALAHLAGDNPADEAP